MFKGGRFIRCFRENLFNVLMGGTMLIVVRRD